MAEGSEELPPALLEAFGKIEIILGDEIKTTLKTKDPMQAEANPFGLVDDPFDDITNTKIYDNLHDQLVALIQRKLGLRYTSIIGFPMHPKIEQFFIPYLVQSKTRQADILLELYVKHLRGMPTEWKKLLIKERDLNIALLENSWGLLMMRDVQKMDPVIAKSLLKKMRVKLDDAEKKIQNKTK